MKYSFKIKSSEYIFKQAKIENSSPADIYKIWLKSSLKENDIGCNSSLQMEWRGLKGINLGRYKLIISVIILHV